MNFMGLLFGALFVLCAGFVVWRFVTLPMRLGRSVQRLSRAVQQRQADKAAGKPVTPINYVGIAGAALAIVGLIVARTTSAITGLGMMVIGMGVVLIGVKMAKEKQSSTGQDGYTQQENGWNPPQQPITATSGGSPIPLLKPPIGTDVAPAESGPLEVQPPVTRAPAASGQGVHDAGSSVGGLQHQVSRPPVSSVPESLAHEHLQASDAVHTDSGELAPIRTGRAGDMGRGPDTTHRELVGRFETPTPTTGQVVGSAERTDSNPPGSLHNALPPPHTRWALWGLAAAVTILIIVVLSVVVFGSSGKPPAGVAEEPPAMGSGSQCGTVRLPNTNKFEAVTIASGDITCDVASSVINRYFSDTGLTKTGNTLAAEFNGWVCAMPTATAAEQDGYSVQCLRDDDEIRVAS
jgi:hypothetical protein